MCAYSLKCELLRHMDGVQKTQLPVIVMACTNCVHSLDPALRRRSERVIRVDPPEVDERYDILAG